MVGVDKTATRAWAKPRQDRGLTRAAGSERNSLLILSLTLLFLRLLGGSQLSQIEAFKSNPGKMIFRLRLLGRHLDGVRSEYATTRTTRNDTAPSLCAIIYRGGGDV